MCIQFLAYHFLSNKKKTDFTLSLIVRRMVHESRLDKVIPKS
nr:MAG TPA: hypothetical protein [Caudoviricetes sp.]